MIIGIGIVTIVFLVVLFLIHHMITKDDRKTIKQIDGPKLAREMALKERERND